MILVDTNIWRELSHELGHPSVKAWLFANDEKLILSAIVLAEIRFGVASRPYGVKRDQMQRWTDALETKFAGDIISFDAADAKNFGELSASAKARGQNIGEIDVQIAAQATSRDLIIATRNVKDFQSFGIELINPWEIS